MLRESALRARYGRGVVVLSALAAMSAAWLVGPPTASGAAVTASTPWAVMSTPHLAGTNPDDELKSVSCPTTTFCMAVGSQISNTRATNPYPHPLAEVWTGKWKVMPTPVPSPYGYELDRVSCSSASLCLALGPTYSNGFAEVWNGATWSVTTIPTTDGQILDGVSCVGSECVAVGSSLIGNNAVVTLAALWNGQSWSVDPTSVPGGLGWVSCFGALQCLAVGESNGTLGTAGPALAQYFNNGSWTDASPSNGYLTPLSDVSCVAASATCMALQSGVGTMLWNASTESWTTSSLPPDANVLASLSCATTTWCVAVGGPSYAGYGMKAPAVGEAWNGASWTNMNTNKLGSPSVNPRYPLYGVSCPSSTLCVAVGFKQSLNAEQPLAASWGTLPGSGGLLGL